MSCRVKFHVVRSALQYSACRILCAIKYPSIKYPSSCREDQRLSTEGKIVSKYCNISETLGGGGVHPLPLYHGGGMNLRVCSRVKCLLSRSTDSVEVTLTSNSYFPWWRLTSHSHHLLFFHWLRACCQFSKSAQRTVKLLICQR